jgi:uncharacterized protein (TIGR00725 family)
VITIAVIGSACHGPHDRVPDHTLQAAYEVGRLIANAGAALFCGGTTGVMEATCRGAREAGGLTIGVLPGVDRNAANAFVDISLPTGLGTARNLIYTRGCDATIMVGGNVGTLNELTIAYQSHRNVVVVEGTGGWADRLRGVLVDGAYLDDRRTTEIALAASPAEAVERAMVFAHAVAGDPSEEEAERRWQGDRH